MQIEPSDSAFAERYDVKVETKTTAEENIAFNIPRVLRDLETNSAR